MKKFLFSLLLFVGLLASGPSVFAIDGIIHDVADHTIGAGHHQDYYNYDQGYGGYAAYPGYYGYRQPHYRHTYSVWSGGHHHHRSTGLGHFGLRHGHGHAHGHRGH